MLAAWRIVAHTLADASAAHDPRTALEWLPGHPEAQRVLARQQWAQGDQHAAASTARRLLEREPLQSDAWSLLGDIHAASGQRDDARSAYARAIELSPRNAPARLWLIDDSLAHGHYPAALGHIDRLLRSTPSLQGDVLSSLARLAGDPDLRESLVSALATSPVWRQAFLQRLARAADPETTDAVMAGLRKEGALTADEYDQWIDGLMARGDWSQAYARWASALSGGTALAQVYNGDFASLPTGKGFDWRIPAIVGATAEILPSGGVRIDYRNRRIAQAGLEQALFLGPGSYRLTARMRPLDLRADRGLEWVVTCAGNGATTGRTPPIKGRGDWQDVEATLRVPRGCDGQWLRLQNAARIPALQEISGGIEIERVAIVKRQEPTPG